MRGPWTLPTEGHAAPRRLCVIDAKSKPNVKRRDHPIYPYVECIGREEADLPTEVELSSMQIMFDAQRHRCMHAYQGRM